MRAEYTPSIETILRATTALGGESKMRVSWIRVPALALYSLRDCRQLVSSVFPTWEMVPAPIIRSLAFLRG